MARKTARQCPDFELGELQQMPPDVLSPSTDRQDAFVLSLALAYNDMKDVQWVLEQLSVGAPADRTTPTAHLGQWVGMRGHHTRIAMALLHELLRAIWAPPTKELAAAVDARFASMQTRTLRQANGRLIGRPPGEDSPYLLTGLLWCGVCGGGMEVLSSARGGRRVFHYRCYVARRKGPACCTNKLPAPMQDADAAVLRAVETTLLHPAVVARALAYAEAAITRSRSADQLEVLETDLTDTEAAIRRLTKAIVTGGELDSLVTTLQTYERHRSEIEARLQVLREPQPALDAKAVRAKLNGYLRDWQGLLRGHVHQAQQVLRRLVKGRLTLAPQEGGYYTFSGTGTVQPLLAGVVRILASPTGSARIFTREIRRSLRKAA